ncbi:hypothetical protein [Priestia flexa]|uniref:hypothetical protein n=1 Tax=Priestia flexa TaxID=86664 RepID=UPI0004730016|nr:hypothetical protein [Priestia flexa]
MTEPNQEDSLYIIDRIKTLIDQLEEKCEVSSMTMGEYKECEYIIRMLRFMLDQLNGNVYFSQ